MSRSIANQRFKTLCRDNRLRITDLAVAISCSRQAIHAYATRRRPLPRLERDLASLCGLSVQALRAYLFPPANPSARRQHAVCVPRIKCSRRDLLFWTWTPSDGERFHGPGERLGGNPDFHILRSNGMSCQAGAYISGRIIGRGATVQLFAGPPPANLVARTGRAG